MYGNEDFSNWLLIPSRPDDFFLSPASIYICLVPKRKDMGWQMVLPASFLFAEIV